MKKEEKIEIIKWYIKEKCSLGKIQTEKDNTNDLKLLEKLVMDDRAFSHSSICSTCWYNDRYYSEKCTVCKGDKYTFPYGYWKKFYERNLNQ